MKGPGWGQPWGQQKEVGLGTQPQARAYCEIHGEARKSGIFQSPRAGGAGPLGGRATGGHMSERGGARRLRDPWWLTSRRGRQRTEPPSPQSLRSPSQSVVAVAAAMAQYKGAASEAGRAMHLMKKREKQREQMEQMKQRIAEVRAGPGPLTAGARTAAPTSWDPARPWAAGLECRRRVGVGTLLANLQQGAEAGRRQSAPL